MVPRNNILKLIGEQEKLDIAILESCNKSREETLTRRVMALIDEGHELFNVIGAHKYWKRTPAIRHKVLKEYVDMIHFALSLKLDYPKILRRHPEVSSFHKDMDNFELMVEWNKLSGLVCGIITDLKLERFKKMASVSLEVQTENLCKFTLSLGELLGFTAEEIIHAYLHKNEVNHLRQATNY